MATVVRRPKWAPSPPTRILHLPRQIRRKQPTNIASGKLNLGSDPDHGRSRMGKLETMFDQERSFSNNWVPPIGVLGSAEGRRREKVVVVVVEEEEKEVRENDNNEESRRENGCGEGSEEKWRFQAEMLRAECKFLRMEKEIAVKKLEKETAFIEKTLKSALHTLIFGKKKIREGGSMNAVFQEEIEELARKLVDLKRFSRQKDIELQNCNNFDKRAAILQRQLEKLNVLEDDKSVREMKEFAVPRSSVDYSKNGIAEPRSSADCSKSEIAAPRSSVDYSKTAISAPRSSIDYSKKGILAPRSSIDYSKSEIAAPRSSVDYSKTALAVPRSSVDYSKKGIAAPRSSIDYSKVAAPRSSIDYSNNGIAEPRSSVDYSKNGVPKVLSSVENCGRVPDVETLKRKLEGLSRGMLLKKMEEEFGKMLSNTANASAASSTSSSRRCGNHDLSSGSFRLRLQEGMPGGLRTCSGHCKAIVKRIMEQVRAETEQWSQMQEMLGQVRDEMEDLQASRDFWEERALSSNCEIQSLHASVQEWKKRALSLEVEENRLQKQVRVLQGEVERLKMELEPEVTKSKELAPTSRKAALLLHDKENRALICHVKENSQPSENGSEKLDGSKDRTRKLHSSSSRLAPMNRLPLRDVKNLSHLANQNIKGSISPIPFPRHRHHVAANF